MTPPRIDSLAPTSRPVPDPLTLFRRSGRFESDPFEAGADVTIRSSGNAVLRLDPGAGFTFTQTAQTRKDNVDVGDRHRLTVTRVLSTTLANALNTEVVVVVFMDGEASDERLPQRVTVRYASAFITAVESLRRMIRRARGRQ